MISQVDNFYQSGLDRCFVVNPDLVLRPDGSRAVVYVRDAEDSEIDPFVRFIEPTHAVLFSLNDGESSVRDVLNHWAYLRGDIDLAEAAKDLQRISADWDGPVPVLLPADKLDGRVLHAYEPFDFIPSTNCKTTSLWRCEMPIAFTHVTTFKCKVGCLYCYSKPPRIPKELLELRRLDELLSEAEEIGITTAVLTGGDPLCHPKALELIELYVSHGITPKISTKCYVSKLTAEALKSIGLEGIQISIDSRNPAEHDFLVRRKGNHQMLLESLQNLQDAGLLLRTNTVVTAHNLTGAVDLIPYLAEEFSNVRHIELSPYGKSLYHHSDSFYLSRDQYGELVNSVSLYDEKYPHVKINAGQMNDSDVWSKPRLEREKLFELRPICSAGRWGFTILPNGEITLCEELYYHPDFVVGDLRTQSIMEMWNSERLLGAIYPAAKPNDGACSTCSEFIECNSQKGRCFKNILHAYGMNASHWPDPACPNSSRGQSY